MRDRWLIGVLVVVGGALLTESPGLAQGERIGAAQTLTVTADPGVARRVFNYVAFGRDCSPRTPPAIVVRTAPTHGAVSTRPNSVMVTKAREGAQDCSGREMQGVDVLYTSQPGYHGADRFEYDVVYERGAPRHDTALVTVR